MTTRPKKFYATQDFKIGARRISAGDELSQADAAHVSRIQPHLVTNDGPKARKDK